MAISYVKECGHRTYNSSLSVTLTITVSAAPVAGHLVIARWGNGNNAATGVTDSKGNTWTLANTAGTTSVCGLAYTFQNVAALTTSDTVTVTFGGTGAASFAAVLDEFAGVASIDVSNKATITASTSRTCGSAVTTNANDLIFAAFAVNALDTLTAGASYTALGKYTDSGNHTTEAEYQIVSATGTYSPTGTGTATASGGGCVSTFKATVATTTVYPAGLDSRETFGTAVLRSPQYISGVGAIPSKQAFGQGDTYGVAVYGTAKYGGGSAATLSAPDNTKQTVYTTAIGSAEAVGTPVLRIMGQLTTVRPAAIASTESVGIPSLFAVDRTSSSYGAAAIGDGGVFAGAASDTFAYAGATADALVYAGGADDTPVFSEQVSDVLIITGGISDIPGH